MLLSLSCSFVLFGVVTFLCCSLSLGLCVFLFFILLLLLFFSFFFFFFSSRRRHTRCLSDWSSDVCSSDLRTAHPIPRYPQLWITVCVTRSSPTAKGAEMQDSSLWDRLLTALEGKVPDRKSVV